MKQATAAVERVKIVRVTKYVRRSGHHVAEKTSHSADEQASNRGGRSDGFEPERSKHA